MIKNQQDFGAGLMFIFLGAAFALLSTQYQLGSNVRMGPGFFPFWLGIILTLLGIYITIQSCTGKRDHHGDIPKANYAIATLILGSITSFGITLNYLGLYLSILFLVIISSLASHEFSLKIAVLNALFLLFFTWLAFVQGLGLVFPEWPTSFLSWPIGVQIFIPSLLFICLYKLYKHISTKGE